LLLDEPLGALDLPLRRRILPYLIRVRDEFEVPMIVVSHDPTEIKALCGEVAVIERGSVVELGRPSSVLAGSGGGYDPLARLENVLGGVVTSCEGGVARVELAGGIEIRLPSAGLAVGERALFGVRAKDILISTTRPTGLSARNVLAARVEGMEEHGDDVLLAMTLLGNGAAAEVLHVELTINAVRELGLARDKSVFLVIKAHTCSILSALPEAALSEGGR
jgi:molybdate transport system ATP-binding protein